MHIATAAWVNAIRKYLASFCMASWLAAAYYCLYLSSISEVDAASSSISSRSVKEAGKSAALVFC